MDVSVEFSVYKNPYNTCCQMSFYPLRIHINRCRLGLRPRPHWGSLQRCPSPRGRRGMEGRGGWEGLGKEGRKGNGEGRGKGGSWGRIASWLLGG